MVQSKHFVAFFLAAAAIANVAALPTPTTTSQEIKHPIEQPVSAVTGTPPAPGPTPHGEPQKNDDSVSDAKKQEDRQARTSEWVSKTGAILEEEALAKKARAKEFEKKSQASSNALIEFVRKAHAPGKR